MPKPVELTPEQILKNQQQDIKNLLLNYLARREYSQKELSERLKNKGFAPDLYGPILHEFAARGWQSEQRFAESYARARFSRGHGLEQIAHELKQKGVAVEIVKQALQQFSSEDQLQSLYKLWQKKYDSLPNDFKDKMKQQAYFKSRGFSFSLINELYKKLEALHEGQ